MYTNFISRVKIYFTIIVTLFVIGMAFVMISLRDNPSFTFAGVKNHFQTLLIAAEYQLSEQENAPLLANAETGGADKTVPVLVYHGLQKSPDDTDVNITRDRFKEHMFALKRAGYTTIDTNELYQFLNGEIEVENPIVITFDDGRRDSFYEADPILRALDFQAVMFAITESSLETRNSTYYLSKNELGHMEKSDQWDIQAHTHSSHGKHTINEVGDESYELVNRKWLEAEDRLETETEFVNRISEDFRTAKRDLDKELNKNVLGFAFPFGEFGQDSKNVENADKIVLSEASEVYSLLFYQQNPTKRFQANYVGQDTVGDNTYLIKRLIPLQNWDNKHLMEVLSTTVSKSLPYSDSFETNRGWLRAWGQARVSHNGLELTPVTGDTGAATILDGSYLWEDYEVTAQLNSSNESGAHLWVRYKDDNNNAACNFGSGFAHVEQTIEGEHRVIKGVRDPSITIPDEPYSITARVDGRTVTCDLNGETSVTSTFLDRSLTNGGIGFKTWKRDASDTRLIIRSIEVTPIE